MKPSSVTHGTSLTTFISDTTHNRRVYQDINKMRQTSANPLLYTETYSGFDIDKAAEKMQSTITAQHHALSKDMQMQRIHFLLLYLAAQLPTRVPVLWVVQRTNHEEGESIQNPSPFASIQPIFLLQRTRGT